MIMECKAKREDGLQVERQYFRDARSTTLYKGEDGFTTLVYHSTEVVKFSDEKIILNTGGWKTATTKARMNAMAHAFDLGFSVFQKDWNWFIKFKGKTIPFASQIMELER